jgi:hypothetical protein
MVEKQKWKYCVGAIFEVEAETREEADKLAEDFEDYTLELVPLD